MNKKTISVSLLFLGGIYFSLFHTAPFPFNHEQIGLPPYHVVHTIFGIVLLGVAAYLWKKK